MVLDAVVTMLWFVLFCMICSDLDSLDESIYIENRATMNAAAAFSFFSILSWAATTYLSNQKYRGTLVLVVPSCVVVGTSK